MKCGVELDIHGIPKENALPCTGRHRPGSDLLAVLFPDGTGEEKQATVRVFGERHAAFTLRNEGVTVLGRDRHPALCIEIDR